METRFAQPFSWAQVVGDKIGQMWPGREANLHHLHPEGILIGDVRAHARCLCSRFSRRQASCATMTTITR